MLTLIAAVLQLLIQVKSGHGLHGVIVIVSPVVNWWSPLSWKLSCKDKNQGWILCLVQELWQDVGTDQDQLKQTWWGLLRCEANQEISKLSPCHNAGSMAWTVLRLVFDCTAVCCSKIWSSSFVEIRSGVGFCDWLMVSNEDGLVISADL